MDFLKDKFVLDRIDEIEMVADRLANYLIFHGNEGGLSFDDFLEFEKQGKDDYLADRERVFYAVIARAIKMDRQNELRK